MKEVAAEGVTPDKRAALKYRRVILKLSGESLARSGERGINGEEVQHIAGQIQQAHSTGCEVAVVVGGGNILRGAQFSDTNATVHESTAHYMGMLATVINALALRRPRKDRLPDTRVMSAIRMDGVAEQFIRRRATQHLSRGRIVILAAGIGSPFVTTDTAAAQRALELEADIVLKATRVDGVYSEDPEKTHALLYEHLDFAEVVAKNLRIMDATAIALCREHGVPILVFNFKKDGNIVRAVAGESVGTRITSSEETGR